MGAAILQRGPQDSGTPKSGTACVVCGQSSLCALAADRTLSGATTRGEALHRFKLLQCLGCGHVQKELDANWRAGMENLYEREYRFIGRHVNCVSGQIVNRDGLAAQKLQSLLDLDECGSLLDIGCGEGTFIEAFAEMKPGWSLAGYDVSDLNRDRVGAVRSASYYSGDLARIDRKFDLITLNHVLEHLTDPVEVLRSAVELLTDDGWLVVRVPCFLAVHADFFVLEHCSHFVHETLARTLALAGLEVRQEIEGLSSIEIGFIAVKSRTASLDLEPSSREMDAIRGQALRCLAWAESLPAFIRSSVQGRQFGIFGVGGTGLWLGTYFRGELSFFVDEDPTKQGHSFAGAPILGVDRVPEGSIVFVTFNTAEASEQVCRRLATMNKRATFMAPPALLPSI
jgi:SAM-dependent methyltransferase